MLYILGFSKALSRWKDLIALLLSLQDLDYSDLSSSKVSNGWVRARRTGWNLE
jgi:hypothetical protein